MLGLDEARDERGEGVVVAELDLGGAHRVVFVDDRDGAVADDLAERLTDTEVARADAEIVVGEEHLGDGERVRGEGGLPHLHEARLADGGAGLFFGNVFGFLRERERTHAETDGAGGDDDDLGARGAKGGKLRGEVGDAGGVELADAGSENAGAELDDDAARDAAGDFFFQRGGRGERVRANGRR